MKVRAYLWGLLFFSSYLLGQIPSADLICVTNNSQGIDSLEFSIPTVNCGMITSVNVYQSTLPEGPYSIVSSLTDPSISELELPNPTNQAYYYYLEIEADCPGQSPTPSDTLSNLPPPAISIDRVSVLANGDVSIRWQDIVPSNPKVVGYVIYRVDVGTNAIDTVFGALDEYIDVNATPENGPVFYYVQAIDGCGVLGPIGNNPHSTIHLETAISRCERTLLLSWSPYSGWMNGVDSTEVVLSINGGPEQVVGSTNLDSFIIPELQAGVTYSVYVRSTENLSGITSNSQQIQFDPVGQISQGITRLKIWGASVDIDGVRLFWDWNEDAELQEASINSTNRGFIQQVETMNIQELNEQLLIGSGTNGGPIDLWLQTLDNCDTIRISDTVATAFIQVQKLPDFTNEIQITNPVIGTASTLQTCELIRRIDGIEQSRIPLSPGQNQINDDPGMLQGDEEVCYQLECQMETITRNGSLESRPLFSNIACPSTEVQIQVPNAFRPAGTNRFFRPLFLFENAIQEYQLRIFDRYGQIVFETDDIQQGWDGRLGNGQAVGGVYVYRILITQEDGRSLERTGEVILIR